VSSRPPRSSAAPPTRAAIGVCTNSATSTVRQTVSPEDSLSYFALCVRSRRLKTKKTLKLNTTGGYRGPGLRHETNRRKTSEVGDSVSLVTLRESSPQQTTHMHCTQSYTGHRSTGSVQLVDQGLRGCGQSNSRPPACSEYWSVHCLPANPDRCRWRQFVKTATLQAVMMMMMMIFSSGTRFQNENRCSAVSFIYLFI